MNKLLQRQLLKHFGKADLVPEKFNKLLNIISESYDHYEKDRKMIELSVELNSKEMIELNSQLKKTGKDELAKAHKQLKTLLEDINEVLYSVDMVSYKLIQVSPVCEKIYGYAAAEFFGEGDLWRNVIHHEDRHIVDQQILLLSEGRQVLNQYRIIHKDGRVRWVENEIIPTLDEMGRLSRIDGVTSDISERKRAEKKLEESFSILEATIESTADGILVADFNGKIVRFNKKFVEITGIPPEIMDTGDDEKAIGFVLDQLINPEEFLSKVKELYVQQKALSFDILKFKDGRIFGRYSQPQLINGNCVGRVWSFRDITDRKKAEDKIRESEERYRSLFEQASNAICIADASMKFYDMNPSGCRMLGYSKEEFIQLSVADLFPLEDLKANPFNTVGLQSGKTIRNERRFRRKEGRMIDVEISGKILEDGRFIVFGRDISERKKSEETTLLLSDMISRTSDAIIIRDPDTDKIIFWNEGFEKLYGYDKTEAIGKSKQELLNPQFPLTPGEINTAFLKYGFWNRELIHINKNGSAMNVETSLTLRRNASGATVGILEINRDITEKKNAEAALIKRDRQLTDAAQIAKLGYWEFDILNGLFTFKDQFYTIFKTSAEKMGGYIMAPDRYATLFVFPDDRAVIGMEAELAINSPDPDFNRRIEHRIIYATGETGWMSVQFYIVKDADGRTIKTFGVNQDITERKKGEETLRVSENNLEVKNTELKLKNTELEQFTYIASHDLQEPLRTTSSFVELLQKQYHGKFDEKADKYFTFISDASERMKLLIKNLLDFSRIGDKKELERVDCNNMLHTVLDGLGVAISESGAVINYEPLTVINGYPTELKQLFQNLITNAIKFRKKETRPEIDISVVKKNGSWEFAFKDNGIGIEEEHTEKIFVIFQRLHARTEYEGSGIGLSHCKKIVELHNGTIWVKSNPGEGSIFQFTIPQNNN